MGLSCNPFFIHIISLAIDNNCRINKFHTCDSIIIWTGTIRICHEVSFNLFTWLIKVEVITVDGLGTTKDVTIVVGIVSRISYLEETILDLNTFVIEVKVLTTNFCKSSS